MTLRAAFRQDCPDTLVTGRVVAIMRLHGLGTALGASSRARMLLTLINVRALMLDARSLPWASSSTSAYGSLP
jgi:hypothetical protein